MTGRALRWPQLTVTCPWCRAQPGALCTNVRGTRSRNGGTHDARRLVWISTVPCGDTACAAAADQPCRDGSGFPLPGRAVHGAREEAARQAHEHGEPP